MKKGIDSLTRADTNIRLTNDLTYYLPTDILMCTRYFCIYTACLQSEKVVFKIDQNQLGCFFYLVYETIVVPISIYRIKLNH